MRSLLVLSIIAGNHDLPLDHHDDWYNKNYQRWHGRSKQVRRRRFLLAEAPRADGSIPQNIGLIQDLILGHKATNSGIVYLEDELYEFRAKPDGRTWSVYGSPVSPHVISQ